MKLDKQESKAKEKEITTLISWVVAQIGMVEASRRKALEMALNAPQSVDMAALVMAEGEIAAYQKMADVLQGRLNHLRENRDPDAYAAIGTNGLRITSVLAGSDEEARAEIERQLSKPGRRSALENWHEGGREIEYIYY